MLGLIDLQNDYGADYLLDLVNATKYQPGAVGWSKSVSQDVFDYASCYEATASLWTSGVFPSILEQQEIQNREQIFTLDSDQFHKKTKSLMQA